MDNNYQIVSCDLNAQNAQSVVFETGILAEQASGAVTVRSGDSVVFAAVVASKEPKEGNDFLPLTVDYIEKAYAAGKIPGGFFKREGRATTKEILSSRLIDRPLRPMFPEHYHNDLQVAVYVLSYDKVNPVDILAINAASAAFMISEVPIVDAVAAVRVGKIDGQLVINPSPASLANSTIDMTVAGTEQAITMVESGSSEVSEEELLEALGFALENIKKLAHAQKELASRCGKEKTVVPEPAPEPECEEVVDTLMDDLKDTLNTAEKTARVEKLRLLNENLATRLNEKLGEELGTEKFPAAHAILENRLQAEMRRMILEEGRRIDGRRVFDIRPITCYAGILPRTHGSAIFKRGQTQSLGVCTLGATADSQVIDGLDDETKKRFILHYNFPPFSTGECKPMRGPGRREIGHGALAERALRQVIPSETEFPYTIRVVSEIMSSNGSSSMASVCSGCLALMDAGVPIKAPVAGIAMGLIKEGDHFTVLSDILGDEDHFGDMDFKVAGTEHGVNALQMDIKIIGVTLDIMRVALQQAKDGRMYILGKMLEVLDAPRKSLSPYAPRIVTLEINPDKIKNVIGPGGKMIRKITEDSGAQIEVTDDGKVVIMSPDASANDKAVKLVHQVTDDAEVGKIYIGTVKRIMNFGAFVEILPGIEGLVHISQLENRRVNKVEDVVNIGDEVKVKCIEIDAQGRVNLSRKAALEETPQE
ncbi:MAG: polyribonucleotide nucleotidyltransferase [Candidatus Riflebacteria bacterium]|nr:polyribonucleotide nucleotidyltransferase [Candidatus Riflebacteria bacterium]